MNQSQHVAEATESAPPSHTPGPWVWHEGELFQAEPLAKRIVAIQDAARTGDWSGVEYAEPIVQTDGGVYGPRGADRALIASSPALLEALKDLERCVMRYGCTLGERDEVSVPALTELFDSIKRARVVIAKAEGRDGHA